MRYAMIMAGGAGTRLWPMSRQFRPKQLLPLFEGRSLLQIAIDRLGGLVDPGRRLICTAEAHRAVIRECLPAFSDEQILGEPQGRDTLNAVGLTAAVLARQDPDSIFAVLTADHLIEPLDEFARGLELGYRLVEDDPGRFMTFAVAPTYPATGYGYVQQGEPIAGVDGAYEVGRFVEKPDRQTAEQYLKSGAYGWNSGMFVFHAASFMERLERDVPESHAGLRRIADAWGTDRQQAVLNEVYPALPKTSVDYGVMEPASRDPACRIGMVPLNITWLDVGSWPSYGQTLEPDENGNASNAASLHLDSSNVLAVSDDPEHTIATVGCRDLVIVRTGDVTLVCPHDHAERVKELATRADPSLQ